MHVGPAATAAFMEGAGPEQTAEIVAKAYAQHLLQFSSSTLPPSARAHWREVARLLKTSAEKPVPASAAAAIRSWPTARVSELLGHIRALHADLERIENERWEDEIRDKVRHSYL